LHRCLDELAHNRRTTNRRKGRTDPTERTLHTLANAFTLLGNPIKVALKVCHIRFNAD
jgi:hypothetical protein